MIVNLIIIAFILLLGNIYINKYGANADLYSVRKRYVVAICIVLILQSGLRNVAVGTDTYTYSIFFENTTHLSWSQVFERFTQVYQLGEGKDAGYTVFEKLVSVFSSEYQIFLFVIAIIFFIALGQFLLKNTTRLSDLIMAFVIYSVLFYSFFSITGHRQTVATALCLFGIEYVKKRKLVPFLILMTIAFSLHKSSAIFLIFYFVVPIKSSKTIIWMVLLMFPILMVFRDQFNLLLGGFTGYQDYEYFKGAGTSTFSFFILLIMFVVLYRYKAMKITDLHIGFAINAFAIGVAFVPLTWVNPSAMRVVQYFSIFMLLIIPSVINTFQFQSVKTKRVVYSSTILLLTLLFIRSNWNAQPYGFFWEKMQLEDAYFENN